MATFTERKGTHLATVRIAGHKTVCETFDTKTEAKEWARAKEAELKAMRPGAKPVDKTVLHAMLRYRDEVAVGMSRDSTAKINTLTGQFAEKRKLPFLNRMMSEVERADISKWVVEMEKTLKPNSVFSYFEIVARVFAHAKVEWNYLKHSPFEDLPWPVQSKGRKRRPTTDEIDRLMLACNYEPGMKPTEEKHFVAIGMLFCMATAMRVSEMLSLTDKSIIDKGRVAYLPTTKNGDERWVPLSATAKALVALLPKKGKLIQIENYNRFAKLWDRVRRSARVKGLTFHDTRREGATRLAKQVHVMTLAKITGHRDTKILLNTYYQPDMGEVSDGLR